MTTQIIKVQPNDSDPVGVDIGIIEQLKTIKTMVDDLCSGDTKDAVVPLPMVSLTSLQFIIEYGSKYIGAPILQPCTDVQYDPYFSKGDLKFLEKMTQKQLFDVILAAQYLDFHRLFALACRFVAVKGIAGKSSDEIRRHFHKGANQNKNQNQ